MQISFWSLKTYHCQEFSTLFYSRFIMIGDGGGDGDGDGDGDSDGDGDGDGDGAPAHPQDWREESTAGSHHQGVETSQAAVAGHADGVR